MTPLYYQSLMAHVLRNLDETARLQATTCRVAISITDSWSIRSRIIWSNSKRYFSIRASHAHFPRPSDCYTLLHLSQDQAWTWQQPFLPVVVPRGRIEVGKPPFIAPGSRDTIYVLLKTEGAWSYGLLYETGCNRMQSFCFLPEDQSFQCSSLAQSSVIYVEVHICSRIGLVSRIWEPNVVIACSPLLSELRFVALPYLLNRWHHVLSWLFLPFLRFPLTSECVFFNYQKVDFPLSCTTLNIIFVDVACDTFCLATYCLSADRFSLIYCVVRVVILAYVFAVKYSKSKK